MGGVIPEQPTFTGNKTITGTLTVGVSTGSPGGPLTVNQTAGYLTGLLVKSSTNTMRISADNVGGGQAIFDSANGNTQLLMGWGTYSLGDPNGVVALYIDGPTSSRGFPRCVMSPLAPQASANYGLLSLGSAPFDGASAGYFAGSSNGTHIAANEPDAFRGDFLRFQRGTGGEAFRMAWDGTLTAYNLTIPGTFTSAGTMQRSGHWTETLDASVGLLFTSYLADGASTAALRINTSGAVSSQNLLDAQNNGTTKFAIGPTGRVTCVGLWSGAAALATNATVGFVGLPSSTGVPTGTPASIPTGQIPLEYDSTNDKFYAYNGSWAVIGEKRTTVLSKSSTYTVVAADHNSIIKVDTSGGAVTVNLPAVASSSGLVVTVQKTTSDANAVTLDGNASETINGATTLAITGNNESATIYCDGSVWRRL